MCYRYLTLGGVLLFTFFINVYRKGSYTLSGCTSCTEAVVKGRLAQNTNTGNEWNRKYVCRSY